MSAQRHCLATQLHSWVGEVPLLLTLRRQCDIPHAATKKAENERVDRFPVSRERRSARSRSVQRRISVELSPTQNV